MGKIVKYCNSCEEGFAEKFGYCPNCAAQLQAFEMVSPIGNTYIPQGQKPAEDQKIFTEEVKTEAVTEEIPAFPFDANKYEPATPPVNFIEASPVIEEKAEQSFAAETPTESFNAKDFDAQEIVVKEPEFVEENKTVAVAAATAATENTNGGGYYYSNKNDADDDAFRVTVLEEKNVKQRNGLLLGSLLVMCVVLCGAWLMSLLNKDFLVGSIDQEGYVALLPEVDPVQMEEEPQPKKAEEEGGGGGGGGRDEETPVQKGRLADQTRERILINPDKSITQVTDPELKIKAQTVGDNKRPITDEVYGLKNGTGDRSNGMGTGGGMGMGRGNGQGTGDGSGEGSGRGSGSGSGDGSGNGGGRGTGDNFTPPPPIAPRPKPVTVAFSITSKPRANYTDAARQNQVQGTVTLRVTFLANGQIGSISPVSGLPYGLTEQAIAAARNIRFTPQTVDGVPKAVTKQVQYSFTIY